MRAADPVRTPRMLVDAFGRHVSDLRVSLTDRCNFRCVYRARAELALFGVGARGAPGEAPLRADPDKDSTSSAPARTLFPCPEGRRAAS